MLLVTAISILTGSNALTLLLEYINLFSFQSQWQYKVGGALYPWPHTTLYLMLTN